MVSVHGVNTFGITHHERLRELDFLKAIAILAIICGHLVSYTSFQRLGLFHGLIMVTGLGFFSFLSGFSLHYSNGDVRTKEKAIQFIRKRVLRIYPLYLAALLTFLLCFQYLKIYHTLNLTMPSIIIHGIGAHVALSPGLVTPVFTLWYVGFIIMCYLSYPLIVCGAGNKKLILTAASVFLIFLLLRLFFNMIDITVFWYYPTFVAGVFVSRNKHLIKNLNSRSMAFLALTAIITAVIFIPYNLRHIFVPFFNTMPGTAFNILITNAYILSTLLISFALLGPRLCTLSKRVYGIIFSIAFASFAAYLFHRPIFAVLAEMTQKLGLVAWQQSVFMIIIGLPMLFFVSYFIQTCDNKVRAMFSCLKRR